LQGILQGISACRREHGPPRRRGLSVERHFARASRLNLHERHHGRSVNRSNPGDMAKREACRPQPARSESRAGEHRPGVSPKRRVGFLGVRAGNPL
jgi:hypothetical protein